MEQTPKIIASHPTFIALTWIFCLCWLALIPTPNASETLEAANKKKIAQTQAYIDEFLKKYQEPPYSLTELRAYVRYLGQELTPYDAFGARIDYARLNQSDYYIRSFGRDGEQNTILKSKDESIASWIPSSAESATYEYPTTLEPMLFPSALVLGSDAPNNLWRARVFIDPREGRRRLIVQHRKETGLLMIARHDFVEEFLWMPSGYAIIYTATSSEHYGDGLYLWNLLDDSTVNLLAEARLTSILPMQKSNSFYLSLSSMTTEPNISFFLSSAADPSLNPSEFFNRKNWYVLKLDEKLSVKGVEHSDGMNDTSYLNNALVANRNIQTNEKLEEIQRKYLQLPGTGPFESAIMSWQDFAQKNAHTPAFPYCLWMIGSFYATAAHYVPAASRDQTPEILLSYGVEMNKALARLYTAPSYLRAIGAFQFDKMMQSGTLPYYLGAFDF